MAGAWRAHGRRRSATGASADIANWGNGQSVLLEVGNFEGWVDEIVIRSNKGTLPVLPGVVVQASSSMYVAPAKVSLTAAITGALAVQKVQFYSGDTKIGEDSNAPYALEWAAPQAGHHSIIARVQDVSGLVGISAPIGVTVTAGGGPTATLRPLGIVGGQFRLQITGQSGITYRIQSSKDGRIWSDIGNVALGSGDTSEFLDVGAREAHKFYRAAAVP